MSVSEHDVRRLGYASAEDAIDAARRRLAQVRALVAAFPFLRIVLWEQPGAAIDQRRIFRELCEARGKVDIAGIFGGNRSGKTTLILLSALLHALGGDHPAVRLWLDLHQFPRDLIPPGPADVFVVGITAALSRSLHRIPMDETMLPTDRHWIGRNSKDESYVDLEVPGHARPGRIHFKSYDQGWEKFQGSSQRFVALDEEPLTEDGPKILVECQMRVLDQRGQVWLGCAAVSGMTWTHERFFASSSPRVRTYVLDMLDNPHLDRAYVDEVLSTLDDAERERRRFGRHVSRQGAVFAAWDAGDRRRDGPGHVCEPFEIPPDWPRFRGCDLGLVNPTCVLWGAVGDDDTLYVYLEHYQAGLDYDQHAEIVLSLSGDDAYEGSWGDPAAGPVLRDWAHKDLYFANADNNVKRGISAIRVRLGLQKDGRPRLKVFSTCANLLRELPQYRWDPKRRDDAPIKRDDHAVDALRYLVMGVDSWSSR